VTIQIDFWQLVLAVAGLLAAIGGAFFLMFRMLLAQDRSLQDERFSNFRADIEKLQGMETRFSTWLIEASEKFVRREDYVRNQTVIEAKLDAIGSRVELSRVEHVRAELLKLHGTKGV